MIYLTWHITHIKLFANRPTPVRLAPNKVTSRTKLDKAVTKLSSLRRNREDAVLSYKGDAGDC